jgi:hypothetical protein
MARQMRRKIASDDPTIVTQMPSAVLYMFDGAV